MSKNRVKGKDIADVCKRGELATLKMKLMNDGSSLKVEVEVVQGGAFRLLHKDDDVSEIGLEPAMVGMKAYVTNSGTVFKSFRVQVDSL